MADLNLNVGSEQGGLRPILIISNDIGNRFSPTVMVACLTSSEEKKSKLLPTHVHLAARQNGLDYDSIVMLEQVKTVDKLVLMNKVAHLKVEVMDQIDVALMISAGLGKHINTNKGEMAHV